MTLSYSFSKKWEILLKRACVKQVRKTMSLVHDEIKKKFMAPSFSRLQSLYNKTVYFLPLSLQEFLVLNWPTSEGWKAELTLEPPGSFEPGTPGLGIQCLNHQVIALWIERAFNKLNMCLISGILTNLCCGSDRYTVYVNVFLLYSYQMVKSKSYFTINKTEKIVTINQQNKTENTYGICLLINTDVLIIILFSREWFVVLL